MVLIEYAAVFECFKKNESFLRQHPNQTKLGFFKKGKGKGKISTDPVGTLQAFHVKSNGAESQPVASDLGPTWLGGPPKSGGWVYTRAFGRNAAPDTVDN